MEEPFVPQWFRSQLSVESDNRLRIRFSYKRRLWQIEAKRFRAKNLDRPLSPLDDEGIREQDGYDLLFELAPTPTVACPNEFTLRGVKVRCGADVRVPVRQWRETHCPACKARLIAPYFPLGADVLERLRYLDPMRDGLTRVFADADVGEAQRVARARRDRHNYTEALIKEERRALFDIPMVGVK